MPAICCAPNSAHYHGPATTGSPTMESGSQHDRKPVAPAFIVGTGRCGSTMLSEMLSQHPDVLSLSEFFPSLGPHLFRSGKMDGKWIWNHYSRQSLPVRILHGRGIVADEIIYPYSDPKARFPLTSIPPILLTTLPHITKSYEALYDELAETIPGHGMKRIGEHYRWLFDHLQQRFDRRLWVERSGMSLAYVSKFTYGFPDARIIHIFRDGRDTAISMSKHPYFHILVNGALRMKQMGIDGFQLIARNEIPVLFGYLMEWSAPVCLSKKLMRRLTLADFGWFWSELICHGVQLLDQLPDKQHISIRYEQLQTNPREKIERMIQFLDPSLFDDQWLDRVSKIPDPTRSSFKNLTPHQQRELTSACEPGLRLLGYTA